MSVHEEDDTTVGSSTDVQFVDVRFDEASSVSTRDSERSSASGLASQAGTADLLIPSKHIKIFTLPVVAREAGEISIASITLIVTGEKCKLAATTYDFSHSVAQWWETKGGVPVPRAIGPEASAFNTINVQPKPPKLKLEAPGLRKSYYTNEAITIDFNFANEEDDDVVVSLEARMISPVEGTIQLRWVGAVVNNAPATSMGGGVLKLPHREVGTLTAGGRKTASISITESTAAVDHEVELTATYHLASEPETILNQILTVDIGVVRPT